MVTKNKTTVTYSIQQDSPRRAGLTAEDMQDLDELAQASVAEWRKSMFRPHILHQAERIREDKEMGAPIEVYVQVSPTQTRLMPYAKALRYCQVAPPQPRRAWRDGRGVRWVSTGALSEDNMQLAQPMLAQGQQRIAEHRLVMARLLGRPLRPGEWVRHIDGDKRNNAPENLRLMMKGTFGRSFYDEWQRCLAELQATQEALAAQETQFGDALDELVALLELWQPDRIIEDKEHEAALRAGGIRQMADEGEECAALLEALWAWVGAPPCGEAYIHRKLTTLEEEVQRHEALDRGRVNVFQPSEPLGKYPPGDERREVSDPAGACAALSEPLDRGNGECVGDR